MGRGRAKAKQTKVARELKYSSPGMDLDRLQRDLQTDSIVATNGDPHDAHHEAAYDDEDEADTA